jgi:hypothetical protein
LVTQCSVLREGALLSRRFFRFVGHRQTFGRLLYLQVIAFNPTASPMLYAGFPFREPPGCLRSSGTRTFVFHLAAWPVWGASGAYHLDNRVTRQQVKR